MKKILMLVACFAFVLSAFAQLPTDTSMKQKKMPHDTQRKDTARLKGGAIIDTIRTTDTINRKVEQMRPKTKDDLKDTVPQNKQ